MHLIELLISLHFQKTNDVGRHVCSAEQPSLGGFNATYLVGHARVVGRQQPHFIIV